MENSKGEGRKVRSGIVLYHKKGKPNDWKFDVFENGKVVYDRLGNCTNRRLISFLLCIDEGKTPKEAGKMAFQGVKK